MVRQSSKTNLLNIFNFEQKISISHKLMQYWHVNETKRELRPTYMKHNTSYNLFL